MEGESGEVYRVDSGKLGCETSELTRLALLALEPIILFNPTYGEGTYVIVMCQLIDLLHVRDRNLRYNDRRDGKPRPNQIPHPPPHLTSVVL